MLVLKGIVTAALIAAGSAGPGVPAGVGMAGVDLVLAVAPAPPEAPPPALVEVGCDDWCRWVREAYGAALRGNISDVIYAAAHGNGVPGMDKWGLATATCESGLNPYATNGWHRGLFQQDPSYWPARAAGAGFPGADAYDPVANAFVTMHMVSSGYSLSHWSCSPW